MGTLGKLSRLIERQHLPMALGDQVTPFPVPESFRAIEQRLERHFDAPILDARRRQLNVRSISITFPAFPWSSWSDHSICLLWSKLSVIYLAKGAAWLGF
jgi:hypothetical protein